MLFLEGAAMAELSWNTWPAAAIILGALLQCVALCLWFRCGPWLLGVGAVLVMTVAVWERDAVLLLAQPILALTLGMLLRTR